LKLTCAFSAGASRQVCIQLVMGNDVECNRVFRRDFMRGCRRKFSLGSAMVRALRRNSLAAILLPLALAIFGTALPSVAGSGDRVHLDAHFRPGQVFRYQLDLQTSATARSEGPITDPQGATRLDRQATATIRMELVRVDSVAPRGQRVRLRVTYEQCAANSQSDALDVQEHEFQEQFRKLQGSSVEFDLEPDGKTDNFAASKSASDTSSSGQLSSMDPAMVAMLQQGTGALAPPGGLPRAGIAVGDKWSSEREFQPAPITGLYWHTDSTYVRNEPCPHPSPASALGNDAARPAPSSAGKLAGAPPVANSAGLDTCAVIQTDLHLLNRNKTGDQTPPAYLHNGLRTFGDWTGAAESVSDIALTTGVVVTMTQTSSQDMDFHISTAQGQASLQYQGHVESALGVTLLP
jgi:hypothetical protein